MYKNVLKRIFDLVLAIIALPFWLLLVITIGPMIYFQDKGSIFYNAPRLGKNGKVFKMYKFRSMKMNAPDLRNEDGSTYNAEDDPRLTKIGKFLRKNSLDEIPQILNVIKGDMSLIGPRPDLPGALLDYCESDEKRLDVRPGITGYSQAFYRNSIPTEEKIKNDVYYVDNLSFTLDVKIFIKTVMSVVKKEHIFVEGVTATTPKKCVSSLEKDT